MTSKRPRLPVFGRKKVRAESTLLAASSVTHLKNGYFLKVIVQVRRET